MEAACLEYADNHDLSVSFNLSLESTDVTFEGYGKHFKIVKFNYARANNMADALRRLKEAGGESIVKGLIPILKKDGFEPIPNDAKMRECVQKYAQKHPIRQFFNDKTKRDGLALGLLITYGGSGEQLSTTHIDAAPFGGTMIMIHLLENNRGSTISKNSEGIPQDVYAIFFNEEKSLLKFVKIARAMLFGFGKKKDSSGYMK